MVKKGSGHRTDGMRAPVSDILPAPFPCMLAWNLKEAKIHEKNAQDIAPDTGPGAGIQSRCCPGFRGRHHGGGDQHIRHGLCQRLGRRLCGWHVPPEPDHHARRGGDYPQPRAWPQLRPDVRAGQCAGSVALYRRHARRMVLRRSHRGIGRPRLYGADRH